MTQPHEPRVCDALCRDIERERDQLAATRFTDAALVRQATEADIARQVLILAEDPKILGMWADTCQPRPVTVADHFRALAAKLSRPTPAEVKP
ncbi:hypothetical protein MED01_004251 [Micromonospora sp. MED01]|uniref:hypothetical protein n=1 Tax=Micromonospora alfalfae TaxID=2911212 RepID=UPI001EE9242E|nr:hypothetical protein [Micromonospora alfalfae]MCG5460825.1 hypothetical protein [Micromonospora alfalfae]